MWNILRICEKWNERAELFQSSKESWLKLKHAPSDTVSYLSECSLHFILQAVAALGFIIGVYQMNTNVPF